MYYVKWKAYSEIYDSTWEPREHLQAYWGKNGFFFTAIWPFFDLKPAQTEGTFVWKVDASD